MASPQVLIVAGNSHDVTKEDLQPLRVALARDHEVTTGFSSVLQHGYGVTWWEVVLIYIATKGADAITGHAFELLLKGITDRAQTWYRARRKAKGNNRPLFLSVLDEDGHTLHALEMSPHGDIRDVTERERQKTQRPRPEPDEDDLDD